MMKNDAKFDKDLIGFLVKKSFFSKLGEIVKPSFFFKKNNDFHKISTLKNEETPLRKVSKIDPKIMTKNDAKIIETIIQI